MSGSQPLTRFSGGNTVRIDSLNAGARARGRLCALGLTPGTSLQVSSCGPGPCRLKVRGSDVVIGAGLAEKIMASPLS
jgi:ferrous iron transport protein A